jgi:2-iminobutanoate/2-iminopropanoate deaminase
MSGALRLLSGNPGEEAFGYSQGIRHGEVIAVSGQVGRDNPSGALLGPQTMENRCRTAIANVHAIAGEARLVAVQAHITERLASAFDDLVAALRTTLAPDAPALTLVPVAALASPDYLVEISAMATTGPVTTVTDHGPIGRAFGTSRAVSAGGQVHVGGQLPLGSDGEVVGSGTAAEHLDIALGNLAATLAAAGTRMEDVVSEHVFIAAELDADGFEALRAVHARWFAASKPTSTLLFVPELPFGALVQVSAVALAGDESHKR